MMRMISSALVLLNSNGEVNDMGSRRVLDEVDGSAVEMAGESAWMQHIINWELLKNAMVDGANTYLEDRRKREGSEIDDEGIRRATHLLEKIKPDTVKQTIFELLFAIFSPEVEWYSFIKNAVNSVSGKLALDIAKELIQGEFIRKFKVSGGYDCGGGDACIATSYSKPAVRFDSEINTLASPVFKAACLNTIIAEKALITAPVINPEVTQKTYDKRHGVQQILLAIRKTMSAEEKKQLDASAEKYKKALIVPNDGGSRERSKSVLERLASHHL